MFDSLPSLMRSRDESDDEEALISSLAHSTLTHALPSIKQSDIHLETTLSPSGPVCLQKKALLIGIQYYNSTNAQLDGEDRLDTPAGEQLKGPHVDVQNMRQLLLDCYGYNPDDITVLIDDGNPKHVQPTKENLIRSMKDLVADARSGDHFYLHFSGHGTQLANVDGDGWDVCILTCDHEIILDDTLNQILVAPLPVGSTFVSSFDSSHSGTVLDLMHYRCNRVYVPWVNKGVRHTEFIRNIITRQETQLTDNSNTIQVAAIQVSEEPAATELSKLPDKVLLVPPNLNVPYRARRPGLSITTHLFDNAATPIKYSIQSPSTRCCTGRCREEPERDVELKADVVLLSATKDCQISWENAHGSSMTEALIKVLRNDPHSSLTHILTTISHELHTFYIDLHVESRAYIDAINKINIKRQSNGKTPLERRKVEMDNFQNPQLSSHLPLDMNRPWPLALKPYVPS